MATQAAPNGALPKSRLSETVRADDEQELDESEVESDAEEEVEVRQWSRPRPCVVSARRRRLRYVRCPWRAHAGPVAFLLPRCPLC